MMIALPIQKVSTVHTITSSRSHLGSGFFKGFLTPKLRTELMEIVPRWRRHRSSELNVPFFGTGPFPDCCLFAIIKGALRG